MAETTIKVVFDDKAMKTMQALKESTGKSLEEVIREALGFYDWARQHVENGRSVAVVDHKAETVQEFVLPFKQPLRN
jgi:hypothetical protein